MGERNSVWVFKGPAESVFRNTAVEVVSELGGRLEWDVHPAPADALLLTSHNATTHAAYIHVQGSEISKRIGSRLAIPWMNLRIQEGLLWDYSLFDGESHVDSFSTLPEYWENDKDWQATQRGKPDLLAHLWQIDQRLIENYLKPWGYVQVDEGEFDTTRRGKAYPTDRCDYGDIWQMNDFLRALGAHDPNCDKPHSIPRLLKLQTNGE